MNLPEAVPERLARRGELLKKMRAVLRERTSLYTATKTSSPTNAMRCRPIASGR